MEQKSNEHYISLAIEEAKIAKSNGDLPFGAIVVCNGEVVGKGHSENNTTGDVTDHAELLALRNACRTLGSNSLKDCVIYCTNEPCIMCSAGIFQADISRVVIGVSRADLPELLRPRKLGISNIAEDSGHPIEIVRDVLKEEILPLFSDLKK